MTPPRGVVRYNRFTGMFKDYENSSKLSLIDTYPVVLTIKKQKI